MPLLGDLSLVVVAAFCGVMLFAGVVHGTLGLGFPLVATPLLALLVDVRSAILLTLLPTVCVNVVSIVRGGRWGESIGKFWPLASYAVAGSALGTGVLVVSDPAPFKLLLATLVLLYLATARLSRLNMRWVAAHLAWSMLAFGLLAGFSAGTTNVMVPILIIYTLELGLARNAMVQVFNLCFLAGKVAQIVVFGTAGLLTAKLLLSSVPLALVATTALAAGMFVRDRIPTDLYRRVVRIVLLVIALLLIGQYAVGM